jgi:hypothetical protein
MLYSLGHVSFSFSCFNSAILLSFSFRAMLLPVQAKILDRRKWRAPRQTSFQINPVPGILEQCLTSELKTESQKPYMGLDPLEGIS